MREREKVERVFAGQMTTRNMNAAKSTEILSGFTHHAVNERPVVRESQTFDIREHS